MAFPRRRNPGPAPRSPNRHRRPMTTASRRRLRPHLLGVIPVVETEAEDLLRIGDGGPQRELGDGGRFDLADAARQRLEDALPAGQHRAGRRAVLAHARCRGDARRIRDLVAVEYSAPPSLALAIADEPYDTVAGMELTGHSGASPRCARASSSAARRWSSSVASAE